MTFEIKQFILLTKDRSLYYCIVVQYNTTIEIIVVMGGIIISPGHKNIINLVPGIIIGIVIWRLIVVMGGIIITSPGHKNILNLVPGIHVPRLHTKAVFLTTKWIWEMIDGVQYWISFRLIVVMILGSIFFDRIYHFVL